MNSPVALISTANSPKPMSSNSAIILSARPSDSLGVNGAGKTSLHSHCRSARQRVLCPPPARRAGQAFLFLCKSFPHHKISILPPKNLSYQNSGFPRYAMKPSAIITKVDCLIIIVFTGRQSSDVVYTILSTPKKPDNCFLAFSLQAFCLSLKIRRCESGPIAVFLYSICGISTKSPTRRKLI